MSASRCFVPAWPVLSPTNLLGFGSTREVPFPLSSPSKASFYVARNGIYHLFRTLGFRGDEEVLVPDYHSGNEVWAIRAAGAGLKYYSIRRNLEPDLDEIERLAGPKTRALYLIHFMGWPQPLDRLLELCRERNLILIEDCALALLSCSGRRPLGSLGDYAVYCLYKTLPVPNGGLLVRNNPALPGLDRVPLRRCSRLSVAGRTGELVLNWLRSRSDFVGRPLSELKRLLGRRLTDCSLRRIPVGDIGFDLGNVDLGMSSLCDGLLRRFDYSDVRTRRRANYERLSAKFAGRTTGLRPDLGDGVCPLFYPILVSEKHRAAEALHDRGIEAVEFWNYGDPAAAERRNGDAQFLRDHVLELPIHQVVSPAQVDYIAEQVLALGLGLSDAASNGGKSR